MENTTYANINGIDDVEIVFYAKTGVVDHRAWLSGGELKEKDVEGAVLDDSTAPRAVLQYEAMGHPVRAEVEIWDGEAYTIAEDEVARGGAEVDDDY